MGKPASARTALRSVVIHSSSKQAPARVPVPAPTAKCTQQNHDETRRSAYFTSIPPFSSPFATNASKAHTSDLQDEQGYSESLFFGSFGFVHVHGELGLLWRVQKAGAAEPIPLEV